ncbi:MAG: hypothetical protein V1702_05890 [Candidatus Woesearchaeota archaeon]
MKFVGKNTIRLDRILNDLDRFVLKFVKILETHTNYVIVSGYVAILFGRSRTTEDVDIFIPKLDKGRFSALYSNLKSKGYWCLNAENADEIYSYLVDGLAVRFAEKGESIPNFEVKFAIKLGAIAALNDVLTVVTAEGSIKISSPERQIAYKKYCLKSEKDMEDAAHLEKLFKEHLDLEKLEALKRELRI